jgi:hypothetical protein
VFSEGEVAEHFAFHNLHFVLNAKSKMQNPKLGRAMFDFTAAGVRRGLIAFGAEFFMFQFTRRFFINTGFIILHFAFLADQIDIGVFSSWHNIGD